MRQSYQEVSKVILKELVTNSVDLKKVNYQQYFYDLKMKNPENYNGLSFDTNGEDPYSEDLESIFRDFVICGFMDLDRKIIKSSLEDIMKTIKSLKEEII